MVVEGVAVGTERVADGVAEGVVDEDFPGFSGENSNLSAPETRVMLKITKITKIIATKAKPP